MARRKWKQLQTESVLFTIPMNNNINKIQIASFSAKSPIIIICVFYPKFGVTNKRITINTLRPFIVLFRGAFTQICCSALQRHSGACSGRQVSLDGHVFPLARVYKPRSCRGGERARCSLAPLPLLTLWHQTPRIGGGENEALELKNLQLVAKLLQVFELLALLSESL